MKIKLSNIKTDAGTQMRVSLSNEKVEEYASILSDGGDFPPVSLFDDGRNFYLVDGFHRYMAHEKLKIVEIEAELTKGTLRDAILHSLKANTTHGLPRTIADKRKAVNALLDDDEWSSWSSRKIAQFLLVSHTFVTQIKADRTKRLEEDLEGEKVATLPPAAKSTTPSKPELATLPPDVSEQNVMIEELVERNADLEKKLALKSLPEEEQGAAERLIEELREENQLLKVELDSVKRSRDQYQAENVELKKQVKMQGKALKKLAKESN